MLLLEPYWLPVTFPGVALPGLLFFGVTRPWLPCFGLFLFELLWCVLLLLVPGLFFS